MKLRNGGTYITRDGNSIIKVIEDSEVPPFCFRDVRLDENGEGEGYFYTEHGRIWISSEDGWDLVKELPLFDSIDMEIALMSTIATEITELKAIKTDVRFIEEYDND